MSPRKTLATTHRVLRQLGHDKRTLALLFVVPPMLLTIIKYAFQAEPAKFNQLGPMLLAIFPMAMMYLVASIATLRERTNGTLERLMTMPAGKLDFILGYAAAFSLVALVQAIISAVVVLGLLHVTVMGGTLAAIFGALASAFLGTSLGLFTSAFATSEFQAIQFMPTFIFPQLLLCGLFVARDHMARFLQLLADMFPLTYSVDIMKQIAFHAGWSATLTKDFALVLACALAALVLGSLTIRRRQ